MFIYIRTLTRFLEKISVSIYPILIWFDENLRWQAKQHDEIQSLIFSADDIWYPKLDLTNAYSDTHTDIDMGTVRVYSFGMAVMAKRTVMRASWSIDVKYYPFDTQVYCLGTYVFSYTHLNLYKRFKKHTKHGVRTRACDSVYLNSQKTCAYTCSAIDILGQYRTLVKQTYVNEI